MATINVHGVSMFNVLSNKTPHICTCIVFDGILCDRKSGECPPVGPISLFMVQIVALDMCLDLRAIGRQMSLRSETEHDCSMRLRYKSNYYDVMYLRLNQQTD